MLLLLLPLPPPPFYYFTPNFFRLLVTKYFTLLTVLYNLQEGNKGMSLEARKQRDAEQMRLKQMKAQQKTPADAGGSAN